MEIVIKIKQTFRVRACSHRVKTGTKAKRIKAKRQTSNEIFAFASAFARGECTFRHQIFNDSGD